MDAFDRILGSSPAIELARAFGRRAAAVDAPVLITGESGTGKGLLARAIHDASPRARSPFVAVNCAGIPDSLFESEFFGHNRGAFTGAQQSRRGLLEQADRGSLFLDEIGELAVHLQAKLLCALEDGEVRRLGAERAVAVDTRLIAATGIELLDAVARGAFRRDLLHRLLVLSFRMPALRERGDDLDSMAHHYLDVYSRRYGRPITGFDRSAQARLRSHTWPGNVRELAHAIEAAVLACDGGAVGASHLPLSMQPAPLKPPVSPAVHAPAFTPAPAGRHESQPKTSRYSFDGDADQERQHVLRALQASRGNRTRAAAALGMSRLTLRRKIIDLGLEPTGN